MSVDVAGELFDTFDGEAVAARDMEQTIPVDPRTLFKVWDRGRVTLQKAVQTEQGLWRRSLVEDALWILKWNR